MMMTVLCYNRDDDDYCVVVVMMMTVLCCSGGETLHRLNGMLVSRWSNEILQQQFRVIIPAAFQLVRPSPLTLSHMTSLCPAQSRSLFPYLCER